VTKIITIKVVVKLSVCFYVALLTMVRYLHIEHKT